MEKQFWRDAKKTNKAWSHIKTIISGDKDSSRCLLCGAEVELEQSGRKRESILLELARKHFYKHKLNFIGGGQ